MPGTPLSGAFDKILNILHLAPRNPLSRHRHLIYFEAVVDRRDVQSLISVIIMAGRVGGTPWSYEPSLAAAMIFLILFALVTIWHLVIVFRRRVYYFIVLVIGGARKSSYHFSSISILVVPS